jgi:hypothetical protein
MLLRNQVAKCRFGRETLLRRRNSMRTTLLAALTGGVLMTTLVWSSAQATSAPDLKSALGNTGAVTLVGHGGGGAGHAFSSRSFSGSSGHFKMAGGNFTGGRTFSKHSLDSGPSFKGRDRFVGNNWNGGKNLHEHHNQHFAMHDHDRDFNHFNRNRVFRNGVWVWAYGPGYYAGDDCWWLLRQARVTGSPYWWSRYDACVGYY